MMTLLIIFVLALFLLGLPFALVLGILAGVFVFGVFAFM